MSDKDVIFAPRNKTLHPYYPHQIEDRNDIAKLVCVLNDLDFLAFKALTAENLPSNPGSGLSDAAAYIAANYELTHTLDVLDIAEQIRRANRNTAKGVLLKVFYQINNFKMKEKKIETGNEITRQHAVPAEIHRFAVMLQLDSKGPKGRGRSNQVNLTDIYMILIKEGIDILNSGATPTFVETGRPEGCVFSRITFDYDTDQALRDIKKRAEEGAFEITPYNEISLIALAVNLMELAIERRKK